MRAFFAAHFRLPLDSAMEKHSSPEDSDDDEVLTRMRAKLKAVVKLEPDGNKDAASLQETEKMHLSQLSSDGNELEKYFTVVTSTDEVEKQNSALQSALQSLDTELKIETMEGDSEETPDEYQCQASTDKAFGLQVFQTELRFQLFEPSQIYCSLSGDLEADFGMNHTWVSDIQRLAASDNSYLVSLLYLMSSVPNILLSKLCCNILTKIIEERPDCGQNITTLEFATVFVNLGIRFDTLNVAPQWTKFTEEDMARAILHHFQVTNDIFKKSTRKGHETGDLETNLRCILNIIMLTNRPGSKPWEEAATLFLMMAVIILDKNLPCTIACEIQDSFAILLDAIKDTDWTDELANDLSEKLCEIALDHRDQRALVRSLPCTCRGNLLKKQSVIKMLNKILNVSPARASNLPTLNDCLFLVKTRQIHRLKDYSMLNSVVLLLDEFISCDIKSTDGAKVAEISKCLQMVSNSIRDQINCLDGTDVKLTILFCTSKWKPLASSNTVETTMTDYMR